MYLQYLLKPAAAHGRLGPTLPGVSKRYHLRVSATAAEAADSIRRPHRDGSRHPIRRPDARWPGSFGTGTPRSENSGDDPPEIRMIWRTPYAYPSKLENF